MHSTADLARFISTYEGLVASHLGAAGVWQRDADRAMSSATRAHCLRWVRRFKAKAKAEQAQADKFRAMLKDAQAGDRLAA